MKPRGKLLHHSPARNASPARIATRSVVGRRSDAGGAFIIQRSAFRLVLLAAAFCLAASPPAPPIPAALASLPANSRADVYAERIHTLGRDLPADQQRIWADWMRGPKPVNLEIGSWHWLVNDVMDALCGQKKPVAELTAQCISICNDSKTDPVLRDYAIQHLVERFHPVDPGDPYERDPRKRKLILSAMQEVARYQSGNLAGTALQALNTILRRQQQPASFADQLSEPIETAQFQSLAIQAASAEAAGIPCRISALQICAERQFKEALPIARNLAANAKEPVSLRLSAIALLGAMGTSQDTSLLEALRKQANPRLIRAIEPALKKLSGKADATMERTPAVTASLILP